MAAPTPAPERGQVCGQVQIDLLLAGDVTMQYLADVVQEAFLGVAKVSITISEVKKVAALWDNGTFNIVFLKMTSLPVTEELEAVDLIRFGKMKNTQLLFVSIVPENFKGCVTGYGADITLTEPLTMEKINIVVKYWITYFSNTVKNENSLNFEELGLPLQKSCSDHLGRFSTGLFTCSESPKTGIGLELQAPLSDFEKSKKISLLHSSKEKQRRERIKYCYEQLRALLPYIKGRKNDVASVLEATVEYVKYIREKTPPALMEQITEALQSNLRFCKKQQAPVQHSLASRIVAQREDRVLTSTPSPVRGVRLLAENCSNIFSVPASGDPLEEDVRAQSSSTAETSVGDMYKTLIPSPALSLSSFHSVSYYPKGIPSYDSAAVTNQSMSIHFPSAMPKVSKFLPQHCNSVLGQTCATHPNCLPQFWAY
ncbi:spermatogenesis- and oogenesis-specific basic helix-loop-helix-containing protein 2 isoform X1 [Sorex araneus]|uniref:spermatogenesis- and oogenesis-specific basic helix-loop-helix-containing protein 2 isoform X1 n=1 Tax=Sorex araneus TaxID=42254 RepID=UPI002433E7EB|nr:spermatogenesis- and oogenesis-specific basic helix-loop-helix-containing protein 2 isoform X1 [Sorex araneus]